MEFTRRSAIQTMFGITAFPLAARRVVDHGSADPSRAPTVEDVVFPSEGAALRGLLYLPEQTGSRPPIIIMTHGTTATVRMVADRYAERFSAAGVAVLLYDHRNLGQSGGEPRDEINPWVQCRGYLDAINFVESLSTVDATRIAIWGDSYSAGEVILVGAIDDRVKAIVAQCPVCGAEVPSHEANRANFETIRETLLRGDVSGSPETTIGPMPVVSSDQAGTPSLLPPIQAFRWFIDYGGRAGTYWNNRVTRCIPETPIPYSPALCAPYVRAPILMMVAPEDEMIHANYDVARFAYDLMPEPKEWYDIRDGHFGLLYYPGEVFEEATSRQIEFLQTWLLA